MLSLRIKSVVALWVLILTSNTFADSPVVAIQKSASSLKSTTTDSHFTYPSASLVASDFIETGIMFVYNEHILNYFQGDTQKLIQYIDANIAHNNQAFINSNIPIKRVVTGLVYVAQNDIWSSTDAYTDRLHALTTWQSSAKGKQLKTQQQYSYLVSLAGFATSPDETTMLGQAFVGDSVSWVSPFTTNPNTWLERTLAHELSHNDGFKHANEGTQDEGTHIARFDAAGYQCGAHGSIMYVSGLRTEPFFSDADIRLDEKQIQTNCGLVGQANAAQVYRDLLNTTFATRQGTFSNIQPTRAKTGVVSIHANNAQAVEGQDISFDIIFEGANAGDSVNIVMRKGTAGFDDFESTIGSVIHDGVNNTYPVSMPIYSDNVVEDTEYFSYHLVYPNGVTIDEAKSSFEAVIIDINDNVSHVQQSSSIVKLTTSGQTSNSPPTSNAIAVSASNSATVNNNDVQSSQGGSVSFFALFMLIIVVSLKSLKIGR